MGVQDAQLHLARETVYGTPVTPTRSIESRAGVMSSHKLAFETLQTQGVRANKQTHTSARRRKVKTGASGSIPLSVTDVGMGMIFRAMMGTSTGPTQQTSTIAYLQTHTTSAQGPDESLTVQIGLPPVDPPATPLPFTYHGGKVKSWEFSQEIGDAESGILGLTLDMDYEDVDTTTPLLAVPVYPAVAWDFGWPDLSVTVNAAVVEPTAISLSGDNGLKTDRRYMRGNVLKKKPVRTGIPDYKGSITVDFETQSHYATFVAGTVVPIVFKWTGPLIVAGQNYELTLTMQACQYDGETPEGSFDDTPKQPLPFTVLWDGTNPAVKLEYKSIDTAF